MATEQTQQTQQTQRRRRSRGGRGQGLPEYALILVLVAIASIVALVLIGTAVQRVVGLAVGGVGGNAKDTSGEVQITITSATCYVVQQYTCRPPDLISSGPATGIRVEGTYSGTGKYAGLTYKDLVASTNNLVGADEEGKTFDVKDLGTGKFYWSYFTSKTEANQLACPVGAVVQGPENSIAASNVEVVNLPSFDGCKK